MQPSALPWEIRTLPVPERLALAELIWDSIVDDQHEIELSEVQKAELDRRLALRNRDRSSSWNDVRSRIVGDQ